MRLDDILSSLGSDEKIIFTMNRADAHESDELIAYLQEKGFAVQAKGGHGDDYFLHVWREEKSQEK